MLHHADASPKPSPDGPTSSELLAEPSAPKKSVSRCLNELQNPSSPTKPRKLCKTESMVHMPVLHLGDAVLTTPIALDNVLPLPVDLKFEDTDKYLNIMIKDKTFMDVETSDTKDKQSAEAVASDIETSDTKDKQSAEAVASDNENPADNENPTEPPVTPVGSLPMVRSYSLDLPTDPEQLQKFNEEVETITCRIHGN
jgi:hypothetical protein